jgi:DNA-binding PadR family transcriptional regulator
MAELTTTSYALLGLLSLRPHTAYDLTQQARRSLAFIWPVSESQLYAEPKRLVSEGLVAAQAEPAGPRRTRQVYELTDLGREALAAWCGSPPSPPGFGSEILLRLAFADCGDKEALLRAIARCRADVAEQYRVGQLQIGQQLDGSAPYLERANLNVVWWALIGEQLRLTLAWLDWAMAQVEAWDDTRPRGFDEHVQSLAEALAAGRPISFGVAGA